eukprot:GHVP01041729.1.p1 GENE.GHVP01041729.1~~GHVP01041729.1.p1  ORF type:complete len:304 (-),score=43.13 GHVP01041729.1:503-1414(-)
MYDFVFWESKKNKKKMGNGPGEGTILQPELFLSPNSVTEWKGLSGKQRRTIFFRDVESRGDIVEKFRLHLLSCPHIEDTPDYFLRSDINGLWFLTMPSEEQASKACMWLRQSTFLGEPMKVGIKSEVSRVALHLQTAQDNNDLFIGSSVVQYIPPSEDMMYPQYPETYWKDSPVPSWPVYDEITPGSRTPPQIEEKEDLTPSWSDYSFQQREVENAPRQGNAGRQIRRNGPRNEMQKRKTRGRQNDRPNDRSRGSNKVSELTKPSDRNEDSIKAPPTQQVPCVADFPPLPPLSLGLRAAESKA